MAFEWADKVDGIDGIKSGKVSLSTTHENVFGDPFSIKKGDIVDIVVVKNDTLHVTVENLTLCADIIDGSLITVN